MHLHSLSFCGAPQEAEFCKCISSSGSVITTNASYGEGTGRILLTSVECTGSEKKLVDCDISNDDVSSCTHAVDAGLLCQNGMYIT